MSKRLWLTCTPCAIEDFGYRSARTRKPACFVYIARSSALSRLLGDVVVVVVVAAKSANLIRLNLVVAAAAVVAKM